MRRQRLHQATIVLVMMGALLLPAAARADPATTGSVISITTSSAVLTGVVQTTSAGAWFFKYGTNPSILDQYTTPVAIGAASNQAVAQRIAGLSAGTTYYYRLVVFSNGALFGNVLSFNTSPVGTATTGDAADVTSTSAILTGVTDPIAANPTWQFEYGTTTSYGQTTPIHSVGVGTTAVSIQVTNLTPATTYHFRLVLSEGIAPRQDLFGPDHTFTTKPPPPPPPPKFGRASLASRRLSVRHRHAGITLDCHGAATTACKGKLAISIGGKRRMNCVKATFALRGGHKRTLRPGVAQRCLARLAKAKHHRIHARLKASFSTRQPGLTAQVTLIRG
jgi:hypothetical protein